MAIQPIGPLMASIVAAMTLIATPRFGVATPPPESQPRIESGPSPWSITQTRRHRVSIEVELLGTRPQMVCHNGRCRPVDRPDEKVRIDLSSPATVIFPILESSLTSRLHTDTISARAWIDRRETADVNEDSSIQSGPPWDEKLGVFQISAAASRNGQSLPTKARTMSWRIDFEIETGDFVIHDERRLALAPWPWQPDSSLQDALATDALIDADHEIFDAALEELAHGQLRSVSPYMAARAIVQYCIEHIDTDQSRRETVTDPQSGQWFFPDEELTSFSMNPFLVKRASTTAINGRGTSHDVVCVCVAMLRAAEIPARPIVGIDSTAGDERYLAANFISWLEIHLEGVGWIPVDPELIRTSRSLKRPIDQRWVGFGHIPNMSRRLPMSYRFHPNVDEETSFTKGGLWAVRQGLRPAKVATSSIQIQTNEIR